MVPTFALANAGVELSGGAVAEAVTSPLGLGVFLGLVPGKPIGIRAAVWAGTRMRLGLVGEGNITAATIALLMGSVIAGLLGGAILRSR